MRNVIFNSVESTNSAQFTQRQQITNNTGIYFINFDKLTNILQVKLRNMICSTQYYYPVLIC